MVDLVAVVVAVVQELKKLAVLRHIVHHRVMLEDTHILHQVLPLMMIFTVQVEVVVPEH